MNLTEIQGLLTLIKGIYGHRFFVDEGAAKAWETYLIPFPAKIIKQALDEWVENRLPEKESVPPSAADIMHLADQIWSRQESTKPVLTDQRKCKCSDGWLYFQDFDGYNVAAKCGVCRKIGVKTNHKGEEMKIPYLNLDTLEVMP